MRKYLESFFADFEYEKEDAEFLLSAYDSIAADSDTKIFLDNALDIYNQNIKCDSIARKLDIHEYTVELTFGSIRRKRYKQRNFS